MRAAWMMFGALAACTSPMVGEGDGVVDDDEVPQIGWEAVLETRSHDVAGTAVLVDERTVEIRDFVYDGGGVNARFFLLADGEEFHRDYELTDNLEGEESNGETLVLELPDTAADGMDWNLLTLWCLPFEVSFGDGVFQPPE